MLSLWYFPTAPCLRFLLHVIYIYVHLYCINRRKVMEVSLPTFIKKSGQKLILLAKFVVILEDALPLKAQINLLLWVVSEYESIPTVQSSVYEDAARYRSLSAIQLCTRYE